jgi:hypothetical protein
MVIFNMGQVITNTITVELPEDWENGYGSDFGMIDDGIDLDGDPIATTPVDAMMMVSSFPDPPGTATEATTSYVTVE